MAIQTNIKRSYTLRMVIIALVCIVFGLWGAYDFFIKYPGDNDRFDRYLSAEQTKHDLEEKRDSGQRLSDEELASFDEAIAFLKDNPEQPTKHSNLNIWFQWVYISCLPCGLWMLWGHQRLMRRSYRLAEDGSLNTPNGNFAADQIRDIDMSRWMAKSIAWVVITDNRRIKLDDYIHQNMHLIVGALASRQYPDQWDAEAKPLTKDESEDPEGDSSGETAENDDEVSTDSGSEGRPS